jgi:hypothetical protein
MGYLGKEVEKAKEGLKKQPDGVQLIEGEFVIMSFQHYRYMATIIRLAEEKLKQLESIKDPASTERHEGRKEALKFILGKGF